MWRWTVGKSDNEANSVPLLLQLPTETELGNNYPKSADAHKLPGPKVSVNNAMASRVSQISKKVGFDLHNLSKAISIFAQMPTFSKTLL